MVRVYANPDLEHSMYEYLGNPTGQFSVRAGKVYEDWAGCHRL